MKRELDDFLLDCQMRNLSPRTIHSYGVYVSDFLKYAEGEHGITEIREVTPDIIKRWMVAQMDRGVAAITVAGRYTDLHSFFGYLQREGILEANPIKKVRPPKYTSKIVQTFSEEDIRRLLGALDRTRFFGVRDYALILTLLDTGLRASEACGLTAGDVDLVDGSLKVAEGQGRHIKGRRERIVAVGNRVRRELSRYLMEREKHFKDCPNDWLFPSRDGTRLNKDSLRRIIARIGKKAHLKNVRTSPHTFRHTYAKRFLLNGGDIFSLQKQLGHRTLEMVRKYVNLFGPEVKEQQRRFSPADRI